MDTIIGVTLPSFKVPRLDAYGAVAGPAAQMSPWQARLELQLVLLGARLKVLLGGWLGGRLSAPVEVPPGGG